ncbi:glycosyltransferase family 4 protein [Micromonospora coerulea]|uniref:glycosyltransferase family 4 protein n=1 Tax=Micromonospora coerulea TaxID=47856 RepID=UPI00190702C0|nr:glycosyltransferase family 4 protein [Micromonospora veneta]
MRIVVAHNRYREAQPSGENTIVDAEIAQLTAAGVEVLPFIRSSDEIPTMPKTAKALLPISPIYAPRAQQELSRLLTEHRPDVLHLHNPYPLLSPWVVRTAHKHGVPVVQTVHNYRQVCSSGLYFRDGVICQDCRGRALGVPAIVHRCYRGSRAQSALMATTLAVHRPTWKSVDRFIALTTAVADHLRDYGIPDERIVVKPNAIPDPGQPAPVGEGFLFLGRLSPEKGLDLLLDAWRRHPEGALGQLRIAGDGELRPLVEAAAAERADVTFLGPLDRAGVRAALDDSAVVLATSTWHDVLPTVIIEALASGRPVLGTALGGIPYLVGADTPREPAGTGPAAVASAVPGDGRVAPPAGIEAGEAGWVVAPEPAALAAALPVARAGAAALAPAARARYERTFHPDVVTKQLIDIYAGVARTARPT